MACVGLTAAGWGRHTARTLAGAGGAGVTLCPWAKASLGQEEIQYKREGPINLVLKTLVNLKICFKSDVVFLSFQKRRCSSQERWKRTGQ